MVLLAIARRPYGGFRRLPGCPHPFMTEGKALSRQELSLWEQYPVSWAWPRALFRFLHCWAGAQADRQEVSVEVTERGPKALAIKTYPTSASSMLSQRDPRQGWGGGGGG